MSSPPIVWIVNHYAQEPNGAGGTRHFSLAKQLKARGFLPYVIAASTVHNQYAQRLNDFENLRVDIVDDIPFVWLKAQSYEGNGLKRLWNMIDFARRVAGADVAQQIPKPHLVIGSSPDPFAALGAERSAAKYGAKFIYEIRDLWPLSLIELKRIPRYHPLAMLMGAIERFLILRAKRILVVQQRSDIYLVPRGAKPSNIIYLPNGIDLSLFPEPAAKTATSDFTFMYFGAHGNGNALEHLLYALNLLEKNPDAAQIKLRLIGDGPLKPMLQNIAASLGLKRVSFEPPIPKRDIPALAAEADGLIFHVVDMPVLKFGISANKLFDYLAAKRPVIFACNAPNNPVADADAGLSISPCDADAMAKAMLTLAKNPQSRLVQMGENGRAYVARTHSLESLGQTLANSLNDVLKESAT